MARLFGTDGIRGIANVDLKPTTAYALGRAVAHELVGRGGAIVVGQDTRRSGDMFVSAIGYPRVRALVEGARLSLDRARRLLITPRRIAVTFKEHAAIVSAIGASDPLAARNAMSAHLESVIGELEDFADEYPALFEGS